MKCFVINLDRSAERLARIGEEFNHIGVPFVRVPAVDGRLLPADEIAALKDPAPRWMFPLAAAEIGAFLSHRNCIRLAAESDDDYAAIFEDDVTLAGNAVRFLKNGDWIPRDADVVKLDTHGRQVLLDSFKPGPVEASRIARLRTTHYCTAGYIVSRAAAQRILARLDRISAPIDVFIFDFDIGMARDLTIYQTVPAICGQVELDSVQKADRKQARRVSDECRPPYPVRTARKILRRARRLLMRTTHYSLDPSKLWVTLSGKQSWMRVPFRK
ncbi:MAG: glycosyltransferase family 25 protein [Dongiaceae bacterium]